MRNWKPFIADAVRTMASDGIEHAVAICLAPQNSRTSVGLYRSALASNQDSVYRRFRRVLARSSVADQSLRRKTSSGMGSRVPRDGNAESADHFYRAQRPRAHHCRGRSLREPGQRNRFARGARGRPDARSWTFAFQSQGMSGGAWLGPRVEDTILALKEKGHRGVFLQPIGFLCDHVEVLYDIDIGFKQFAEKRRHAPVARRVVERFAACWPRPWPMLPDRGCSQSTGGHMKRIAIIGGGISGLVGCLRAGKASPRGRFAGVCPVRSRARVSAECWSPSRWMVAWSKPVLIRFSPKSPGPASCAAKSDWAINSSARTTPTAKPTFW